MSVINKAAACALIFILSSSSAYSQDKHVPVEYLHGGNIKTWRAVGFYLESLAGFQECRMDDSFTLSKNGEYRYDGGKELCGEEDDKRIKTGTWKKRKERMF